jgi:hypothetical protein
MTDDEEIQRALNELLNPEARERRRMDELWIAALAGDTAAIRRLQRRLPAAPAAPIPPARRLRTR